MNVSSAQVAPAVILLPVSAHSPDAACTESSARSERSTRSGGNASATGGFARCPRIAGAGAGCGAIAGDGAARDKRTTDVPLTR